ncbi:MAG: cohesin domain-containing protein [bacterium]|nr:cohesin domain-containing protein [bacterium]
MEIYQKKYQKIYKVILVAFLFVCFPISIFAANLSIAPASASFQVGDKIIMQVVVSSRTAINAISGELNVPTSLFTIESVTKYGSVLNFWVSEPNFSKGAGMLAFEGVALGGYQGGTKSVVNVTLRAKAEGTADITFKSGKVLANDGQGTDVTDRLIGATYSITPRKVVEKLIESVPEIEEVEVEQESPQVPATLPSPHIEMSYKFGEQAIHGTSKYPNAQVLTTFVAKNGIKVFIIGETDQNGEFIMLVPKTLKRGEYDVSSVVILKDNTHTYPSNEIQINIGNFFSDISFEVKAVIIALCIVFIYLIIRSLIYIKKNKKLRLFVRSEAHQAEDVMHKSFQVLNEDVDEVMLKKLPLAEREYIKTLKKDLKEAEEVVSKEIKNIEKS